jgi:hypothetical protein
VSSGHPVGQVVYVGLRGLGQAVLRQRAENGLMVRGHRERYLDSIRLHLFQLLIILKERRHAAERARPPRASPILGTGHNSPRRHSLGAPINVQFCAGYVGVQTAGLRLICARRGGRRAAAVDMNISAGGAALDVRSPAGIPVCTENLSSGVVVVKSAEDGV